MSVNNRRKTEAEVAKEKGVMRSVQAQRSRLAKKARKKYNWPVGWFGGILYLLAWPRPRTDTGSTLLPQDWTQTRRHCGCSTTGAERRLLLPVATSHHQFFPEKTDQLTQLVLFLFNKNNR